MNQDKGSYQLPHIYDKLFDAATFSDIQKSFTGKQQQISKWMFDESSLQVVFVVY